jgi:hypothetical protein
MQANADMSPLIPCNWLAFSAKEMNTVGLEMLRKGTGTEKGNVAREETAKRNRSVFLGANPAPLKNVTKMSGTTRK